MQIKDSAKTILCYGDSNTWGAIPRSDDRYPRSVRWTGVLQTLLGEEYEVVSEGLCGRTLVAEHPKMPHRTGITHLQAILESADPIHTVIVMLGTNDVKTTYGLTAKDIAGHLAQTLDFIKNGNSDIVKPERILVICPPMVVVPSDGNADPRMAKAPELFAELPALYREVAAQHGADYINAQDHISSSKGDGYHFDPEAHGVLGKVVAEWVKQK